jgi:lipoprotein signal peptidase
MSTTATRSYRWLFWTLAVLGLCLDQGSKYGIFAWMYNDGKDNVAPVIPGVFQFDAKFSGETDAGDDWRSPLRTVFGDKLPEVNRGALWGIGGRRPGETAGSDFNHFFALVSVIAALAIVAWSFRAATARDRWLCLALGLILAGTVGNLYDRVVFLGVRDFLHWTYFEFPVFNIADSCLVCGAALLLLQAFFTPPPGEKKESQTTTTASSESSAVAELQPESAVK